MSEKKITKEITMRTLSEVIEIASDWTNGFDEMSIEKQMLHYLKEYRNKEMFYNQSVDHMVLMMNEHEDRVAMYLAEMHKNNPLTWSELKQMEGKPIWLEYNFQIGDKEFRDKSKRWCIIGEFKPWHDTEITITENGFVLSKNEQVKCWQAYRKERKMNERH